jgi:preprotein translocase subunit SecE
MELPQWYHATVSVLAVVGVVSIVGFFLWITDRRRP